MRIISGKYKKRKLFSVHDNRTRPTTDFLKEVIFTKLDELEGSSVLDLYAGCGSLGFEALSRGAGKAVLVDLSHKANVAMRRNVEMLDCRKSCLVLRKKVVPYLKSEIDRFDLIFMDPPYEQNLVESSIAMVFSLRKLATDGTLIVQHSKREMPALSWNYSFQKQYGDSVISIIRAQDNGEKFDSDL